MQKQLYRYLTLFACMLLLVACKLITPVPATEIDAADSAPTTIQATFVCPDGPSIDAVFDNAAGTVTITLPEQTLTLPQVISGSGARYSDETTTFWNKGNEATVEINGEVVYAGCITE